MNRARVYCGFCLAASVAFGQGVAGSIAGGGAGSSGIISAQVPTVRGIGTTTMSMPRFMPPAITGAPYSAEQIQEHVQTLADGTHITQNQMREKVFRDSLGRTRTERPLTMGRANGQDSPMIVEIADPVAGVRYTLDEQNKVAHRMTVEGPSERAVRLSQAAGGAPPPPPAGVLATSGPVPQPPQVVGYSGPALAANLNRAEESDEKLAPQIVEGVLAEGVRHTTTFPVGSQGNDRPFSVTFETWTSPDLKGAMVLSKRNDPRSGESTTRLTNISRDEPDPSLFQPPPDYQVVDETGSFTMHFGPQ
jgi:hypothetical protein